MKEIKSYSSLYEYLRSWWGEKDKVFTFSPLDNSLKFHVVAKLTPKKGGYDTIILVQLGNIYLANFFFFTSFTDLYDTIYTLDSFFTGVKMYITAQPEKEIFPTIQFNPKENYIEIKTIWPDREEKISLPWDSIDAVQGILDVLKERYREYLESFDKLFEEVLKNE